MAIISGRNAGWERPDSGLASCTMADMGSRPPPCLAELDAMTAAQMAWDTCRDSGKLTSSEASDLEDQVDETERAWLECIEKAEAAWEAAQAFGGGPTGENRD